jgi:CRP-like cAMP-binding protein
MALSEDIELLSRVELFQGFSVDQLRLIAFGAEHEQCPPGHLLYREGDESDGGYVVARGQIDLAVRRDDRQVLLDSCMAGSLVGEVALITANRRVSDAVARVDSEVVHIPRALFHRMLREYPDAAVLLHKRIAQTVRRMMTEMDKVHDRLSSIPALAAGRDGG